MEVCSAGSSCCLSGPVIKAVRREYFWPNKILPSEGGHDNILWVEVCSQAYSPISNGIFKHSSDIHVKFLCVFVQMSWRRSCRILCLRPTASVQVSLRWCGMPSRRVWSGPEWVGGGLPPLQLLPCLMPTSSSASAGESHTTCAAWGWAQLNTSALVLESYRSEWV